MGKKPCKKCGNPDVQQVDGICFDCITAPLLSPEELKKHQAYLATKKRYS